MVRSKTTKQPATSQRAMAKKYTKHTNTKIPADELMRAIERRRVIVALLSGAIANVPVGRCAIICAVRRAAEAGYSAGELLLLAYVKAPCAIDEMVKRLPAARAERAQAVWAKAAEEAIARFNADCAIKDDRARAAAAEAAGGPPPRAMGLGYRAQLFKCVGTGQEWKTSGLPSLLTRVHGRDAAAFERILQWQPDWQKPVSCLVKELRPSELNMNGSCYKKTHAVRTVAAALGQCRPAAEGEAFLKMSPGLPEYREWLYPRPHGEGGPKRAAAWLARQCSREVACLGADPAVYAPLLKEVENMSAGDEACLVCESKKVVSQLTPAQISAMEWAIRSSKGHDWRQGVPWYGGAVAETADSGVFAGVKESTTELTQLHRRLGAC